MTKKKLKIACKCCGHKTTYKKRYVVVQGEMGTQEILDRKTGKTFYGWADDVINDLLEHLNVEDAKR